VRRPGIASNLSIVPPVWPRDRPESLATTSPAAARRGTRTRVTVSPTPPVECLSTLIPGIPERSILSPLSAIAWVRATVSSSLIPRKYTAMRNAAIW